MDFSDLQRKHFLMEPGASVGTFSFDRSLPKLPVPSLDQTLEKYLISVKPFLTEDQLATTKAICQKFKSNATVQKLQQDLVKRGEEQESWLSQWWLDYGYLHYREPLIPTLNVGGPFALTNAGPGQLWPVPVGQNEALSYVSMFVYHLLKFWKMLREEQLRPDTARDGTRFNMQQFRGLFNTTRIPKKGKDELMSLWKPKREGNSPKHFVVLRKGYIFVVHPFLEGDDGNETWTAPEFESAFLQICQEVDRLGPCHSVATLTRDNRDVWAINREYLIKSDPTNASSLETIETAMFVVVLDEEEPQSTSETCQRLMTGLPGNRWSDKSLSVIQFSNGHGGVNCDHTPIDAMVTVVMSYFIHLGVTDARGRWQGDRTVRSTLPEPKLLPWKLDSNLVSAIDRARLAAQALADDIIIVRNPVKSLGKTKIQKLKVNPDTFVQMALQLAYYRLHGKPAPTYETATTRKYRQGRTETLRSCSNEATAFAKSMDNPHVDLSTKRQLLRAAINTHERLMKEAKEGFGCDRHLLGLSILAMLQGLETTPEFRALYDDQAYKASGGGGNYILSTSTSGYTAMSGGATAMVTDGYGVFYNFEPQQIWLWVTTFRRSNQTSAESLFSGIEIALMDMFSLLSSEQAKM